MIPTPVTPVLPGIALAMAIVYALGRRRAAPWAPLVLRVLAVAGLIIPGWTTLRWYDALVQAREIAGRLPVDPTPVVERFVVSSATLLAIGFGLLVVGIYLARRLERPATREETSP